MDGMMTQGSPALRANPGLNDGIPLGFRRKRTARDATVIYLERKSGFESALPYRANMRP
jgi:hypothetical protein